MSVCLDEAQHVVEGLKPTVQQPEAAVHILLAALCSGFTSLEIKGWFFLSLSPGFLPAFLDLNVILSSWIPPLSC